MAFEKAETCRSIIYGRILLSIIVTECTTPSSAIWRHLFWYKFEELFVETDASVIFFSEYGSGNFFRKVCKFMRDIAPSYPRRG